mmetsp:Transcript_35499/g.113428  ORF Transcript_35499/g.113428 Transcript_35499/m.113428 type:complete len:255 (-) Transcript_35499:38-802(-)
MTRAKAVSARKWPARIFMATDPPSSKAMTEPSTTKISSSWNPLPWNWTKFSPLACRDHRALFRKHRAILRDGTKSNELRIKLRASISRSLNVTGASSSTSFTIWIKFINLFRGCSLLLKALQKTEQQERRTANGPRRPVYSQGGGTDSFRQTEVLAEAEPRNKGDSCRTRRQDKSNARLEGVPEGEDDDRGPLEDEEDDLGGRGEEGHGLELERVDEGVDEERRTLRRVPQHRVPESRQHRSHLFLEKSLTLVG